MKSPHRKETLFILLLFFLLKQHRRFHSPHFDFHWSRWRQWQWPAVDNIWLAACQDLRWVILQPESQRFDARQPELNLCDVDERCFNSQFIHQKLSLLKFGHSIGGGAQHHKQRELLIFVFTFYKGNVSLHVFIVWNKYSKPRHFFYLAHHLVAARTSPGYTRVRETLLEVFWETKSFFSILCAIKQHACGVYDNHSVKKRTETWIISLPAVCY